MLATRDRVLRGKAAARNFAVVTQPARACQCAHQTQPAAGKGAATVVQLLQDSMIWIGDAEYARANRSLALTTLLNRHVAIDGSHIRFQFRGKSSVEHAMTLCDRHLTGFVCRMREFPGRHLFQSVAGDGARQWVYPRSTNFYANSMVLRTRRGISGPEPERFMRRWNCIACQRFPPRVKSSATSITQLLRPTNHLAIRQRCTANATFTR